MLSAGATEADGQIAESAFDITFHGGIYQIIDMIEETKYFAIFFQESDYRLIQSGERFVTLILAGIIHGTAVEYISSYIAGRVIMNSILIGKAHYFDG